MSQFFLKNFVATNVVPLRLPPPCGSGLKLPGGAICISRSPEGAGLADISGGGSKQRLSSTKIAKHSDVCIRHTTDTRQITRGGNVCGASTPAEHSCVWFVR